MTGDRKPERTFPEPRGPWRPSKAQVRILMLTDDDGSFTEDHKFGLTELVSAIESTPGVFAEFSVTKAHRETETASFDEPADADVQGFRFDDPAHFDPAQYDQIWLVGIREAVAGGLDDTELKVIAQFMDGGGGVFATGDHQDLGGALSGEIPRVRSMRKWTYDYSHGDEEYDPASAEGPPALGSFRHDTLVAGHNTVFEFDDQSDDIPAKMHPKYYGFSNKYLSYRYPHPLLCGPDGVITVLPDHMHEGECIVPADLTKSYTFDGYTTTEYPSGTGGQVVPDVIAEGEVFAHPTDNTSIGAKFGIDVPSRARRFGVVGAYDGHEVDVGRVVVDSTFHHFVNINVIASGTNSPDPVKQVGFAASTAGEEAYASIRAYWRNIAIWLARPAPQAAMFHRTLWAARWDSQLRMLIPSLTRRKRISWDELVQYGASVRTTVARFSSPCAAVSSTFAWEHPFASYKWWIDLTLPDPPPWEIGAILVDPEEYLTGLLGAVMLELVHATPERDTEFRDALDRRMPRVVAAGLKRAAETAVPHYEHRLQETAKLVAALRRR